MFALNVKACKIQPKVKTNSSTTCVYAGSTRVPVHTSRLRAVPQASKRNRYICTSSRSKFQSVKLLGASDDAVLVASDDASLLLELVQDTSSKDHKTIAELCGSIGTSKNEEGSWKVLLEGDWVVGWSSLEAPRWVANVTKALFSLTGGISLKLLSFGVLPNTKVDIVGSYNRVHIGKAPSVGEYTLVQVFTPRGNDTVKAAMVLEGSCTADPQMENRVNVQFQTVSVWPFEEDADKYADAMASLRAQGLADFLEVPTPIKAKPTFIDITYIDEQVRVHRGASGSLYVLRRMVEGEPRPSFGASSKF